MSEPRMVIHYGEGRRHTVELKLEDGVVFGRYPATGWEARRPDPNDPRHQRMIAAIAEVLSQYGEPE